jgi:hypothetical protein
MWKEGMVFMMMVHCEVDLRGGGRRSLVHSTFLKDSWLGCCSFDDVEVLMVVRG